MVAVTLVTVAYDSAEEIREYWGNVAISEQVEWVVVDNCPEKPTRVPQPHTVIRLARNIGFAGANNVGAAIARGEVLGFVNPDVRIDADGVAILAQHAIESRALVAPALCHADGEYQHNARGAPTLYRQIRHQISEKVSGQSRYLLKEPTRPTFVPWVTGAALFVRKDVFDAIGGWDHRFFLYCEDAELCLRAKTLGVPTVVVPEVRLLHGWRRASRSGQWQSKVRMIRSAYRLYRLFPQLLLPWSRLRRQLSALEH